MANFEIIFYKTENGQYPVKTFLKSITDKKLYAKILRDINLLSQSGNLLRAPTSSPLTDGLFELRTIQSNNIARIIYFFVMGNRIILTNGFIKKTQKTPRSEIEKALAYKKDYLKKSSGGNNNANI